LDLSFCTARRQEDRLVDAEAAVRPSAQVFHDFRLDFALGQIQGEDGFLPDLQQSLHIKFRQLQEDSIRTDRWRYAEWRAISDGSVTARELYDPKETRNLAALADHCDTIDKRASRLPKSFAPAQRE